MSGHMTVSSTSFLYVLLHWKAVESQTSVFDIELSIRRTTVGQQSFQKLAFEFAHTNLQQKWYVYYLSSP
jgi:hypothetical protein